MNKKEREYEKHSTQRDCRLISDSDEVDNGTFTSVTTDITSFNYPYVIYKISTQYSSVKE